MTNGNILAGEGKCPHCESMEIVDTSSQLGLAVMGFWQCQNCGYELDMFERMAYDIWYLSQEHAHRVAHVVQ